MENAGSMDNAAGATDLTAPWGSRKRPSARHAFLMAKFLITLPPFEYFPAGPWRGGRNGKPQLLRKMLLIFLDQYKDAAGEPAGTDRRPGKTEEASRPGLHTLRESLSRQLDAMKNWTSDPTAANIEHPLAP